MTEIVYSPHYSESDMAACRRIAAYCKETGATQATLARRARVNVSTLNQILNGYYKTTPSTHLIDVEAAIANTIAESKEIIQPTRTSVFELAQSCCKMARKYHNFAVLSANVGTGKTFALKHYTAKNPNTFLIEATPTMTQLNLLRKMGQMICNLRDKNGAELFDAIVATLRGTNALIIIDEAETLIPRVLHLIRRVRDLAGVGVVFAGTEHLTGILNPERGQFEQIRSRAGFWPATVQALTIDDTALLLDAAFPGETIEEPVLQRLHTYCKGSARLLIEGFVATLRETRKGAPISAKLVNAVAKQALCLKPLE